MADLIASLLFVPGGALLALLTFPQKRWGPEGPVGAHMITAPLALAVTVAFALGGLAGGLAQMGVPGWPTVAALPGTFVALVLLPLITSARRQVPWAQLGVAAALLGTAIVLWAPAAGAPRALACTGLGLVAAVAAAGYGMLLVFWVSTVNARVRAVADAREREAEFRSSQSQWQRDEWAKLPPNPELWQLIQFVGGFDDDLRRECHARIAALPDLEARMAALLGTGWAEHALRYLADVYPRSTAPLAAPLAALLLAECERWRSTLDHQGEPASWWANLAKFVEAAERVARDGGDVQRPMRAWAELLRGRRGLESLQQRAEQLARGA